MTFLVVMVSLVVGVVLAEIVFRAFGGLWFRIQVREIGAHLKSFQLAEGDDARQAQLLRSGRATLQFSLVTLGLIVGLLAIVCLAPWVLQWTESQQIIYLVVSSVAATVWWILRRYCRTASTTANTSTKPSSDRAR